MSDYLVTDTELTSIADAIRTKGGTSADLSFPTEFVQAINDIPTGSEPTGTKYIYTDETDITEAFDVGGYKYCSIDYSPVRDHTIRLWVEVSANTEIQLKVGTNDVGTTHLDWGDGTQEQAVLNHSHTYSQAGRYCIELSADTTADRLQVKTACFGQDSSNPNTTLVAVELSYLGTAGWFGKNYASQAFYYCTSLKKVVINDGDLYAAGVFEECTSLETVDLCEGITTIHNDSFKGCVSLKKITIPSTVTNINGSSFRGCTALKEIHLLPTTPPALNNITAFDNVPSDCVFYVPSASLNAYKTASNWSTFASQMVGE